MSADMLERSPDVNPVEGIVPAETIALTRDIGRQPWGSLAVSGYLARESDQAVGAPVRAYAELKPRNAALVDGVLSVRKSREDRDKLTIRGPITP